MQVITSPTFDKQFKKLSKKAQQKFKERLVMWLINPEHSILRVHALRGDLKGHWSMNITGDIRVIYYFTNEEEVVLALIGTHSQLY